MSMSSTLRKLQIIHDNAQKNFERQHLLFEAEVISELQYEEAKLPYDQARAEIDLFVERNKAKWELAVMECEEELAHLSNQMGQIQEELTKRYVTSPVSGTLQNVVVTEAGQFVHSGTKVAELSPGDSLMVRCFVSPTDIGLLRVGQVCNFRVDAFNYNEWGMVSGTIRQISNDVYVLDNTPFFEVRCSLSERYLKLGNGFEGNLMKGMTVQANFLVANRSLYQLLYDKVDDWMNPNMNSLASNLPAK